MKISIVLVIQNQDQALYHCMRSLLEQSCKDFEIIALNNGSTDKTKARLDFYQQLHPSLIHVIHQAQTTTAMAYQTALNQAKGDYVLLLEATQWLKHKTIATLIQEVEVTGASVICAKNNVSKIQLHPSVRKEVLQPRTACKRLLQQELSEQIEGCLIKRDLLQTQPFIANPFFSQLSCVQLILASDKVVLLPQQFVQNNANFDLQVNQMKQQHVLSWLTIQTMKMNLIRNYDSTLVPLCKWNQRKLRLAHFASLLFQGRWEPQLIASSTTIHSNFQEVSQI